MLRAFSAHVCVRLHIKATDCETEIVFPHAFVRVRCERALMYFLCQLSLRVFHVCAGSSSSVILCLFDDVFLNL